MPADKQPRQILLPQVLSSNFYFLLVVRAGKVPDAHLYSYELEVLTSLSPAEQGNLASQNRADRLFASSTLPASPEDRVMLSCGEASGSASDGEFIETASKESRVDVMGIEIGY